MMDIHELIKRSGVDRRTIYYYIQMEVLPPPSGSRANPEYSEEHLARLMEVQQLKVERRLTLKEIASYFQGREGTVRRNPPKEIGETRSFLKDPFLRDSRQPMLSLGHGIPRGYQRFMVTPGLELHVEWPLRKSAMEWLENHAPGILQKITGDDQV